MEFENIIKALKFVQTRAMQEERFSGIPRANKNPGMTSKFLAKGLLALRQEFPRPTISELVPIEYLDDERGFARFLEGKLSELADKGNINCEAKNEKSGDTTRHIIYYSPILQQEE
ncbi:MAG TPA: hypothetical protein VG895_01350 [Patescibacteria group bacterium]|nr:hypothetical protein [Patescibacteria group bacterium]